MDEYEYKKVSVTIGKHRGAVYSFTHNGLVFDKPATWVDGVQNWLKSCKYIPKSLTNWMKPTWIIKFKK